jgi:hypothetical protein
VSAGSPGLRVVETPFDTPPFGVVQTVTGPYAIGSGGILVAGRGSGWKVVLDDGPATRDNERQNIGLTRNGDIF